jgi:hypothetical protein
MSGVFKEAENTLFVFPSLDQIPFVVPATGILDDLAEQTCSHFLNEWILPDALTTDPRFAVLEWWEDRLGFATDGFDQFVPPFVSIVYEPGYANPKFTTFRIKVASPEIARMFIELVEATLIQLPASTDIRYTAVARSNDVYPTVLVESMLCNGVPVGLTVPSWAIGKFIGYQGVACKEMLRKLPSIDWMSLTYIYGNLFGLHHIKVPVTISKADSVQLAVWVNEACTNVTH